MVGSPEGTFIIDKNTKLGIPFIDRRYKQH